MTDSINAQNTSASTSLSSLRVAIVHYWFVGRAGGERVVEALGDIFPQADLFSLIVDPAVLSPKLRDRRLTTSFLQRIPGIRKFHRHTLMLQPLALEQFDMSGYDLVLSSESGPAKGVITSPGTLHVCYCHSPMRYLWDLYPAYVAEMSGLSRIIFSLVAHRMRQWDFASSSRVDKFVCNSDYVASRIRKIYRRDATVIHPPVEVADASISKDNEDYYLILGRLVGYKRVDLAIKACNSLERPLKIIGTGPEYARLHRMAGPRIEFLGAVSDSEKKQVLSRCRALIFPGEEDFGIVPVEAQAYGRPVIAFGSGGVLETVVPLTGNSPEGSAPATGVFFLEQSAGSLIEAILRMEAMPSMFCPEAIRRHALQFDTLHFLNRMTEYLENAMMDWNGSRNGVA